MSQLHLTLKPKASAVFADPHRFTMAVCGRRFGKSYLSCAKALHVALSNKRANVLMIAPTFEMGRATLWRTLQDMVPDAWLMKTSQSSDACCAITPSQPGKRCRIQEVGNDARLSGEDVTEASCCAVGSVIDSDGFGWR